MGTTVSFSDPIEIDQHFKTKIKLDNSEAKTLV